MQFEFATAARIVFGPGISKQLGGLARVYGKRALVVTGRDPSRVAGLINLLAGEGIEISRLSVTGEPDLATVEQGARMAREERVELVVAIGGGSVIDAGKAIAAIVNNQAPLLDFLEVIGQGKPLMHPSLPVIAMPTTAGTGAEVTRNAVLFSPEHRVKVSLRSLFLLPKIALVDPDLTLGLPPALTAATGLDALTQVIEPYVCARPNPIIDGICEQGINRVARSLAKAFKKGDDAAAREDMALASLFGGLALANAGLGAVHGFAGPIGGMFDAPHGAICAALLPYATAANLAALRARDPQAESRARYEQVARWLTGRSTATADDGVQWLRQLTADLEIRPLSAYGIKREHFNEIAEKASRASSMKANPIALSHSELLEILKWAL